MKKWIVAFLSFCMLLGMVGCGTEKKKISQCQTSLLYPCCVP